MSEFNRITDEHIYDRLVDGELSAAERRELLASLDGQADGWRRCAVAFLEAQAMGLQMKACVAENAAEASSGNPHAISVNLPRKSRPTAGAWLAVAAAVAAAVAVAFGAGRFSGGPLPGSGAGSGGQVVARSEASRDDAPIEPLEEALARADSPRPQGGGSDEDVLTLLVRGQDGAPQRVELPLVESGGLDRRLGGAGRWSPPARLVRQLRESGLEVETRRRYAPVIFERSDGIVPMIVPVDDAYLRPVDRRIY